MFGHKDPSTGRRLMVERQILARGIRDSRVLCALRDVPREHFVPDDLATLAFEDRPLPIGHGQTISQPYIVALMAEALEIRDTDTLLEIGAGSGYAAAVYARLAKKVTAIERDSRLAARAAQHLQDLGIDNVTIHHADGFAGWPANAPYDRIAVAAATADIPASLMDQLKPDGWLVAPVGQPYSGQSLQLIRHGDGDAVFSDHLCSVSFVPLVAGPLE